LQVTAQEGTGPDTCWRRAAVPLEACPAIRDAIANGEPPLARCEGCPIQDRELCPDLDGLSRTALLFSAIWDHPAHADYREALLPAIMPRLTPSQVLAWLRRREVIWEERERRMAEAAKRQQPRGEAP
jgi:hypothetical protein